LLESELFGHVKGSYTGATKDTWGKIHEAEGGTLFLDEIGEMPLEIQPKLLRLLQEQEYERVGENKVREANVRIISASNRDLKADVAAGNFREDLYYRLSVISVTIPPLRQRLADLEQFAIDYLEFFAGEMKRKIEGFSECGRSALLRHSWPGNLRELRNVIERASILATGPTIRAEDLTDPVSLSDEEPATDAGLPQIGGHYSLEEIEKAHLVEVIRREPSLHAAAATLGIDNATLYRKRRHFCIA
jgi:NtrC-family two-component system response regulator AlgB